MTFAWAFATPGAGRVHALSVGRMDPSSRDAAAGAAAYERAEAVVRRAAEVSVALGRPFDASILLAPDVTDAIARFAAERHPETVFLGMSNLAEPSGVSVLEELLSRTSADVVVLNAPPGWSLSAVDRVLLPVGGRVPHDPLRARLTGMLLRDGRRTATLLRVLAPGEDRAAVAREARRQAEDLGLPRDSVVLESGTAPLPAILRYSGEADLLILGSGPGGRRRLIGDFTLRVAGGAECPVVAIAQAAHSHLRRGSAQP
jgi:nucleotide-binding universal stress UspA family protein